MSIVNGHSRPGTIDLKSILHCACNSRHILSPGAYLISILFDYLKEIMSIYGRILGSPFVYNFVRPLVVGGIDMSPLYASLEVSERDVVVDVGCGTGDALNYLESFSSYWGFDIDEIAVSYAKERFADKKNVTFQKRLLGANEIDQIKPTRVVLAGLLHHITDQEVLDLFSKLASSPCLVRAVTQDIVYLPNEMISNFFASLDRGRHCRKQDEYEALVKQAGFNVVHSTIVRSHPTRGRVKYLLMTIEPKTQGRL